MLKIQRSLTTFLLSLVVMTGPMFAFAQTPTELQSQIDQALTALRPSADSPPNAALEKELRASQQLLANIIASDEQAKAYKLAADNEDKTISALRKETAAIKDARELTVPKDGDAQTQLLAEYESVLLVRRNLQDDLIIEKTSQSNRANAISKELTRLQALREQKQAEPEDPNPAKALIARVSMADIRQRILTLQSELSTLPARQRILEARIALANAEYSQAEDYVSRLKISVSQNRVLSSQSSAATAREQLILARDTDPDLALIAEETLALSEKLVSVSKSTAVLGDVSSRMSGIYQRIASSTATVDRVLNANELTDETAGLLRRVQSSLPDLPTLKLTLEESEKTQTDLQLRTILWEDRLQTIGRAPTTNAVFLGTQKLDKEKSARLAEAHPDLVTALQTQRRDVLIKLIDATRIDLERRTNTDIAMRETIQITTGLKTRLERRLLWLRTNDSSPSQAIKNLPASIRYLFSPANWKAVGEHFKSRIAQTPGLLLWLVGIPILLRALRPMMMRRLSSLARRVGRVAGGKSSDNYLVTPSALVLSALAAVPLSFALVSAGSIFYTQDAVPNFTQAFSLALTATGTIFFALFTFRIMCREDGLLGAHLGWSNQSRLSLSKHLDWFTPVVSIAFFLFVMGIYENVPSLRYGLALVSFVVISVAISIMSYVFFRPKGGIAASIVLETQASPLVAFLFPVMVAIPLGVGLAPLFGYFDTAIELQSRIYRTGILGLNLAIFYGFLIRTFNIAKRRYLFKRAAARQAHDIIETQTKAEADQSGEARPATPEPVDESHLSIQIRKSMLTISVLVFLFGLWKLWGPLMPALGIAGDITLWENIRLIDGETVVRAVTLSSLFGAGIILLAALIAARNVKTILELLAFDRLNLDSGTRYAAVTIVGYLLVGFGVVFSLAVIGLDWSKLQWVVAALGVGIGFGLQEIIANFISGLIILFERPVRVGDIVTINNLSGTVSNIKIRATTITDFDNREVLLPNKAIITGEVTNWTLNDSVTRVILNIGVAYGTDIPFVRQLFTDVLEAHPDVLRDPAPTVFFIAHGDSSLDFEIRVFVAAPFQRLPTTHDINAAINAVLKENNIEIPFPQRDVNMKKDWT